MKKRKVGMVRANFIGAPEGYNLNNVAAILNEAFGLHNYLVGSALTTRDFRDVDIRCILDDADFDRLFGPAKNYSTNAFWSLICSAISEWISNRTNLKIDFQIQRQTDANNQYDGKRQCLGIFLRHAAVPGDRREEKKS